MTHGTKYFINKYHLDQVENIDVRPGYSRSEEFLNELLEEYRRLVQKHHAEERTLADNIESMLCYLLKTTKLDEDNKRDVMQLFKFKVRQISSNES